MKPSETTPNAFLTRREMILATTGAAMAPSVILAKDNSMTPKAFVYTEVAISVPFDQAPWPSINETIKKQPGFLNKTWLHGHGTGSIGGFYSFASRENARAFVTDYFPSEPRVFGVAHNTRVFDAEIVREASEDLGSVHYGAASAKAPGAFVYTELQLSQPFDSFDWRTRNAALKRTAGLQSKVWLSGVSTQTLGGFDAFDNMETALDYAINQFPEIVAPLGAALYTRVFDAATTANASREMGSPFYS
ncbi:Putative mono-oxygenase ydhR [Thalassococcus halodurans]|uniref:Putative mono-oxygenase ydhR n=1 Tax=Thalassococcus halodurans TaxID=373675 RepID=A0A1H6B190_9RHOB|nr:YdhR family protein [Thalassococcus halodurans]MEE2810986.1 YdhR family protein [Pseudomonadota bacterium]SEG54569.1 Putative mono-oxygenase ydhR [Thalassococcus halodurans]